LLGEKLRVVATHLGLRPAERRQQVQQLLDLFSETAPASAPCWSAI
jgi:endonuclease/exonuclease/phosphatase family metal-dependent hydrolase